MTSMLSVKISEEAAYNAAFADGAVEEVVRILARISADIGQGKAGGRIADINGNTVGEWHFFVPEPEEED